MLRCQWTRTGRFLRRNRDQRFIERLVRAMGMVERGRLASAIRSMTVIAVSSRRVCLIIIETRDASNRRIDLGFIKRRSIVFRQNPRRCLLSGNQPNSIIASSPSCVTTARSIHYGCRQQRKIFAITGRKQRFVQAALLIYRRLSNIINSHETLLVLFLELLIPVSKYMLSLLTRRQYSTCTINLPRHFSSQPVTFFFWGNLLSRRIVFYIFDLYYTFNGRINNGEISEIDLRNHEQRFVLLFKSCKI